MPRARHRHAIALVTSLALSWAPRALAGQTADCIMAPMRQLTFVRTRAIADSTDARAAARDMSLRFGYGSGEIASGASYGLSNPSGASTIHADGAMGLGERTRLLAAVGSCDPKFAFGRTTAFGGLVDVQLLGDPSSTWGVVAQVGASHYSLSGSSVTEIPIVLGLGLNQSERTTWYAAPLFRIRRDSYSGGSYSSSASRTDLGALAGVQSSFAERWGINASLSLLREESSFTAGSYTGSTGIMTTHRSVVGSSLRVIYFVGNRTR